MPAKVLVVEDDPHAVELVRLYLSRDGHTVLTAGDGLEGLRLAREEHPARFSHQSGQQAELGRCNLHPGIADMDGALAQVYGYRPVGYFAGA